MRRAAGEGGGRARWAGPRRGRWGGKIAAALRLAGIRELPGERVSTCHANTLGCLREPESFLRGYGNLLPHPTPPPSPIFPIESSPCLDNKRNYTIIRIAIVT